MFGMSQQTDGERKHVATLELTEEPNADEIAFLIDDTLDKRFVDVESNEDGSYEIYLQKGE
jgi:hypothetical protein